MATTEKTWFTKTIARETVEAKTAQLMVEGEISQEVKTILDGLFAGKTVATHTLITNEDGDVVMKRCSYFEGYLPIDEFGTVGIDKDGKKKFSYQSKAGAAATRATKSTLEKAINEADEQLEVDEDVQAWKAAKSEAVTASEVKAEYDGDNTMYATYEDVIEEFEGLK